MKKILFVAIAAVLGLPGSSLVAVAGTDPLPLCDPVTPGEHCSSPAQYPSFTKRYDECGWDKSCTPYATFSEDPWMECHYYWGYVYCEAWPQTWEHSSGSISYRWSSTGGLGQPDHYGEHSPGAGVSCNRPTGGTVTVQMRPQGGVHWTTVSMHVSCSESQLPL
jgi:hypothetical protein